MTPLDAARSYIRRGFAPVPVPYMRKGPILKGWQDLRIGEAEAPCFFNGAPQNVGVLLGEASRGLVDADLDCAEAVALADAFLPPSDSVFGRAGKRRSHRIYVSPLPGPARFADPETGAVLLELRAGRGHQTIFPGSTHESGEAIEWDEDGEPARVDPDQLTKAAGRLAVACLLGRAAPAEDRHNYMLDVSGALVRALGVHGAAHLLHPVAREVLGGLYRKQDGERLIADTARKVAEGDPATGWPKLAERIGERRSRKLAEWLGVHRQERVAEVGRSEAAEQPWPDPDLALLRPHRRHAPELPLEVFGPAWARWIADAAEAKGAPPDFVALPLLGAVGAAVANARRASPWPGWVEPPIVWAANVGLPSSGKSPAQDAVMDLVRELEHELDLDFDERSREHLVAREVAKAKRERWEAEVRAALKSDVPPPDPPREAEPPEPPARRRLFTVDATVERLARIAAANDRGVLLARDELSGWLGGLDKYGGHGGDRAFYLEAHGGRPHVIDRMKDGAPVRVPFLSVAVLGGIQPDRLASLLFAGDDDGCAARFLFAWPEPRRPKRPGRAPDDAAALGSLRWLLALGQESTADGRQAPKVLPLDPAAADALQVWREQVAELEAGASGLFCSWLGKLPGLAVRLALALELLWWCRDAMGTPEPKTVSLKATHAALALLEAYALPMARRAFGEAALPQADRDAVALARWLRARDPAPETVNARELRHADALPTREAERYDRALVELEAAGWLRPAPPQLGPGRRRKDWLVNPKLWEGAR